ncbi:hypothetical protein BF49_2355 [Bradyrhizobium sp.]|nr:hypothetical protein BF49_2355 [Bradyrhizobium sp.]
MARRRARRGRSGPGGCRFCGRWRELGRGGKGECEQGGGRDRCDRKARTKAVRRHRYL